MIDLQWFSDDWTPEEEEKFLKTFRNQARMNGAKGDEIETRAQAMLAERKEKGGPTPSSENRSIKDNVQENLTDINNRVKEEGLAGIASWNEDVKAYKDDSTLKKETDKYEPSGKRGSRFKNKKEQALANEALRSNKMEEEALDVQPTPQQEEAAIQEQAIADTPKEEGESQASFMQRVGDKIKEKGSQYWEAAFGTPEKTQRTIRVLGETLANAGAALGGREGPGFHDLEMEKARTLSDIQTDSTLKIGEAGHEQAKELTQMQQDWMSSEKGLDFARDLEKMDLDAALKQDIIELTAGLEASAQTRMAEEMEKWHKAKTFEERQRVANAIKTITGTDLIDRLLEGGKTVGGIVK